MKKTVTLSKEDIAAAVKSWLSRSPTRLKPVGEMQFNVSETCHGYGPGEEYRHEFTGITVEVEDLEYEAYP